MPSLVKSLTFAWSNRSMPNIYRYTHGSLDVVCLVTGPFKENSYFVRNRESEHALLVDPGDDLQSIEAVILGKPTHLDAILLTHGHFDHLGAVEPLSQTYQIPVYMDQKDSKLAQKSSIYSLAWAKKFVPTPKNLQFYADSAAQDLWPDQLKIIPTPGHTAGSVSLLFPGFCFTGDTVFHGFIGGTGYPESLPNEMSSSIDRLLGAIDENSTIFPGHGRPWSGSEFKKWWHLNKDNPPQLDPFSAHQPSHKKPINQ